MGNFHLEIWAKYLKNSELSWTCHCVVIGDSKCTTIGVIRYEKLAVYRVALILARDSSLIVTHRTSDVRVTSDRLGTP